jgi:hypothetical protein
MFTGLSDTSFADHDPSIPNLLVLELQSPKHLVITYPHFTRSTISNQVLAKLRAYKGGNPRLEFMRSRPKFPQGYF